MALGYYTIVEHRTLVVVGYTLHVVRIRNSAVGRMSAVGHSLVAAGRTVHHTPAVVGRTPLAHTQVHSDSGSVKAGEGT